MLALAACAFVAFSCEALAGFGGTVLALALGAELRPLGELLAIFIPANLVLSAAIVARNHDAIDWRLLARRIAPAMLAGLPAGLLLMRIAGRALEPLFAAVVVALGVLEAVRLSRPRTRRRGGPLLLWLAGVVHGAWGTGGPLVVFVTGGEVSDPRAFRATLAVLWLLLNAVLVAGFALDGRLSTQTLTSTLALLPVVALALGIGELLAARLPDRPFRAVGAALLSAAGLLLLCRGA
jgi:uncharacterized membrane protein YfcA